MLCSSMIFLSYHHYRNIFILVLLMPLIENQIINVIKCYAIRGFSVVLIHVDIQFKCLKDRKNITAMMNDVSKEEHVVDIERYHRIMKEQARCYYAMLPFDTLPRMMVVQLMNTVVFYLNAFVWRKGVSNVLLPVTIIEGTVIDYYKHFHVVFGEFVQTFKGSDNTMNKLTIDAIALGPNGNLQGGIRCFSLSTCRILSRQACDVHIDSAIR